EAESTPAGAELSPIMENFPRPGCRSLLVSSYSGGTHCCFREALVTSCDSREIFTSLNLAHSPVAMEQGETGWVIHTEDWSLAYYMLDDKRFLPPGIAEPTTRVLRFVPQEGWRPDKPGENPTFHHLFQSDLEDTPPDTSDPERAARAIAAAAHSFLASGSTVSARQTLAQLLPATWLPDLHTILGDIIDSVKSYTPCENTVFGP
ncbi:MAG: hypothetical protein KKB70_00475, partial [Proteobacteria bacterium]|nr:hypothetical protein [Pseudomonadota bacterium]